MEDDLNIEAVFMLIHRDTFMWLVGGASIAIGGFVFKLFTSLNNIMGKSDRLISMHNQADKYGFGTVGISADMKKMHEEQQAQTRATKSMMRLMRWTAEKQFGEKPPPLDIE